MLAIRLARIGKTKKPFYRVVVIDKRRPRNGRFVEVVGTYDPLKKPAEVKLKAERIQYWIGCGAQPSDTVRSFLRNQKIA
ncbi:MAG: 30S ribosomal protein S16 [Acidobacteria bacterium]|nr:MAG: 30S ribosomal protein S16 [Acidobacteriota bacterium]